MWNGTMFVDLDWPLNASSLLSASAELLVFLCCHLRQSLSMYILHLLTIISRSWRKKISIILFIYCQCRTLRSSWYFMIRWIGLMSMSGICSRCPSFNRSSWNQQQYNKHLSHAFSSFVHSFITLCAKLSGAVYCYRSCLWRAGGVFAGLLPW